MSLLSEKMESFSILIPSEVADGYGGTKTVYTQGNNITAAITFNSSQEMKVADKNISSSRYTITTRKNVVLMFHQVLKRLSDGKTFRITSDGDDFFTPDSAGLNMRQVTAEEWQVIEE